MSAEPLLAIEGLQVRYPLKQGLLSRSREFVSAVEDVSLVLPAGQSLGIVGESGCGKTTLGMACAGLTPITGGRIRIDGTDPAATARRAAQALRRKVQVVFQDPFSSLDPRMTIGDIVREPLDVHAIGDRAARRARVSALLEQVGLQAGMAGRYPHELSGGQRQRVGLARALALEPRLVVADEPVSALDVSVKAQIINLLVDLRQRLGLSFLVISHDFSIIEYLCDLVAVMYLGKVVEIGPVEQVLRRPSHPYTQALLAAIPVPDPTVPRRVPELAGEVPSPIAPPAACRFHPRCPRCFAPCSVETPALIDRGGGGHRVACHLYD